MHDARLISLRRMSVRRLPKSGRKPDDVLEHLGISERRVAGEALALVGGG